MKFNWGTGIALAYCLFAGTLVFVVIQSTKYDHSLVRDDYYAADLDYQQHYNKLSNSKNLAHTLAVQHRAAEQQIQVIFPKELEQISGNILFFRPSDSQQDFSVAIQADEQHQQIISTTQLQKGLWKLKIDWSANGEQFYKEVNLVL